MVATSMLMGNGYSNRSLIANDFINGAMQVDWRAGTITKSQIDAKPTISSSEYLPRHQQLVVDNEELIFKLQVAEESGRMYREMIETQRKELVRLRKELQETREMWEV